MVDDTIAEITDVDGTQPGDLEEVQFLEITLDLQENRPFLSTPFSEYSVSEGLLLALLLCVFVSAIVKVLKGGFYWLL